MRKGRAALGVGAAAGKLRAHSNVSRWLPHCGRRTRHVPREPVTKNIQGWEVRRAVDAGAEAPAQHFVQLAHAARACSESQPRTAVRRAQQLGQVSGGHEHQRWRRGVCHGARGQEDEHSVSIRVMYDSDRVGRVVSQLAGQS